MAQQQSNELNLKTGAGLEPVFILSVVSASQKWDFALAPVETYSGQQCLLGWTAQLKAFGAMLQRLGVHCLITPAPEMFFTATALLVAAESAGIPESSLQGAVHIRFGGGRFARVLHGMPNFIATAESAWTGLLAPGAHPFRGQNTAPQAFQAMLGLTGQAGPLMRPDGTEIERILLPRCSLAADLPEFQLKPRPLAQADFAGLEIAALAEFDARDTSGMAASVQARRLILEFNAGGLALERRLVLLPWNLANPASCVPDVAVKYLRAFAGTPEACHLVLLPFNVQREFAGQIELLVNAIRRNLAAMVPRQGDFQFPQPLPAGLMIGQVSDFTGVAALRRMGAVAWVDGADPEAAWTEARLAACGIPAVKLPAGAEKTVTELRDEFGQRFFEGRTLPAREISGLANAAKTAPAPKPAPEFDAGACRDALQNLLATCPATVG